MDWVLKSQRISRMVGDSDYFTSEQKLFRKIRLVRTFEENKFESISPYLIKSKSQLGQDLFVLSSLSFKKDGYFVEFGASDGKILSNTYLLEKEFRWKGILAEPARIWYKELVANRSATVVLKGIHSASNRLIGFHESHIPTLSGVTEFIDETSNKFRSYKVETLSLNDLLSSNNAPRIIDYLSIDTEGSEFEILNSFDFNNYHFRIITVEHNFRSDRIELLNLLIGHGYIQVYKELSDIEYWLVDKETFSANNFMAQ